MRNFDPYFNSTMYDLGMFLSSLFCIFLSLSVHEFSHGFTAYKLGDSTAKDQGRLTLNPFKHIDILGMFCFFVFGFGWARPVLVNENNFGKSAKRNAAIAALAGPLANLTLAFLSLLILKIVGVFHEAVGAKFLSKINIVQNLSFRTCVILKDLIFTNISLAVFNFIPIPPLDGSKIFAFLLPKKIYLSYLNFERYGYLILFVLLEFSSIKIFLNKVVVYIYKIFEVVVNLRF